MNFESRIYDYFAEVIFCDVCHDRILSMKVSIYRKGAKDARKS
jgi:hypothetical protein